MPARPRDTLLGALSDISPDASLDISPDDVLNFFSILKLNSFKAS